MKKRYVETVVLVVLIAVLAYILLPTMMNLFIKRPEMNRYDSEPMTQEELDWYSGKTKVGPSVFAPHPLSEYE